VNQHLSHILLCWFCWCLSACVVCVCVCRCCAVRKYSVSSDNLCKATRYRGASIRTVFLHLCMQVFSENLWLTFVNVEAVICSQLPDWLFCDICMTFFCFCSHVHKLNSWRYKGTFLQGLTGFSEVKIVSAFTQPCNAREVWRFEILWNFLWRVNYSKMDKWIKMVFGMWAALNHCNVLLKLVVLPQT